LTLTASGQLASIAQNSGGALPAWRREESMSGALFRIVRHLTVVALVATPLWASGSSWGQQREARLPAGLQGQMPATLANCNKTAYDHCVAEASKGCQPPYGNGGPCIADRVQACKTEYKC
jgi:hypothetical protein